jgi:isopenicillin N synthase-like dioxygenase
LDLYEKIETAYGLSGLGLLIIKRIPGFIDARLKVLPLIQKLAGLPEDELEKITFKDHNYAIGWSHGKEKFLGKPDYSKGSFYYIASKEEYTPKNKVPYNLLDVDVWPKSIPELKHHVKDLSQLIINVGIELAYHLNKYIEKKHKNFEDNKLVRLIKESDTNTGRLLHYFPYDKVIEENQWCGVHNDYGSMTGLCSALYLDRNGNIVDYIDNTSGLFVYDRNGKEYKASIPKDSLAFLIGETTQILSGGVLRATPHMVKSGSKLVNTGISRNTMAVFLEPQLDEPMNLPKGCELKNVCGYEMEGLLKIEKRFKEGMKFGDFAMATIKSFDPTTQKEIY